LSSTGFTFDFFFPLSCRKNTSRVGTIVEIGLKFCTPSPTTEVYTEKFWGAQA